MGEDRVNDDSVDSIVAGSFVAATQRARLKGLPQDCNPKNAAILLNEAYAFYKEHGSLYDTHPFVLLSIQYVVPLLNGIQELIVFPNSEREMMDLINRGFNCSQVESAKKYFIKFAMFKHVNPAVLVNNFLGTLDDWFTEDFSPDLNHIELLGEFLHGLASNEDKSYF